jgi:uncharacterized coiled-coil protein SlyX
MTIEMTLLGELVERLQHQVATLSTVVDGLRTRFTSLEARFGAAEVRFSGIEERLTGVEDRLGRIDARLDRLEARGTRQQQSLDRIEALLASIAGSSAMSRRLSSGEALKLSGCYRRTVAITR